MTIKNVIFINARVGVPSVSNEKHNITCENLTFINTTSCLRFTGSNCVAKNINFINCSNEITNIYNVELDDIKINNENVVNLLYTLNQFQVSDNIYSLQKNVYNMMSTLSLHVPDNSVI